MIQSLREKIIPSLIATLVVGLSSSFITFKVMAYQVADMQTDLTFKASTERVDAVEKASMKEDRAIRTVLEKKADKEILEMILEQVRVNGEDLKEIRKKQ